MKKTFFLILAGIFMICILSASISYALPGDADGNGIVDLDDARTIARFVVHQIPSVPNPSAADATQDGNVDMEDAFVIAKKVTGQTRIVVVAPRYGSSEKLQIGNTIRIEVFEKFFPFNITGGTVRIRALSTGYDSGNRPLTFERYGRSLYYHWDTGGLTAASDYEITVTLTESGVSGFSASKLSASTQAANQPDVVASLSNGIFEPKFLAASVDAFAPAPGIPLEFRRVFPHDSAHYPYLGPLGRGWVHNFDISLEEYTDGRIAFHGPEGFNRFFTSNADGTYSGAPGDHGALVRNPDGTFQIKEKDGFIYRFRSDLWFDYMQDLNANRITAIYDVSNRLKEIRHSSGKSIFLEYNSAGRIVKLTDHTGRITTFEYDTTGVKLIKVTDPAGSVTEYFYNTGLLYLVQLMPVSYPLYFDPLNYRLLSVKFPDGTYVHYSYDEKARIVQQTGAWGANPIVYSYDADGTTHVADASGGTASVTVNDKAQPLSVTAQDGAVTQYQYDSAANLSQVTGPLSRVTQFSYDGLGNVTQVVNPLSQAVQFGYDLRFNKPAWITDPLGNTTLFSYDAKGNLTETTYPDESSEAYTYDAQGNLLTVTDAAAKATHYTYNTQGEMTILQNALGNSTQFSYDNAGELQNVTDTKGHSTIHTRDVLGRLTKRTYPDGSHEDYEYDAAGKVTAFTSRRGERISFSYDVTGRLEWKQYPSGKQLHFLYDATGYLSSVEQVIGTAVTLDTAYERDALHRIIKAKVPGKVYPESYDVSYAYDAAGNRSFMAYSDGYSLTYEYDGANRLTRISDAGNNTVVSYEYDAGGRRAKRTLGNSTYTTYTYNNMNRLTSLINYSPSSTVQSQFSYAYNPAGMRTSMTTVEGTHSYTYDNKYQLTKVVYPDSRTVNYAFDQVGNRASVSDNGTVTNYTTNTLDQYTQAGLETFAHDANGNLTTRSQGTSVTTYGWDEDDRLVSVDRNGTHIDYKYDHQGRLISKTIGGQEVRYIWDGLDLIAEMDSAGAVTKRYIYGATIDEILLVRANGTNYWAQQDGLDSVVGTTNDSGAIVMTASYDVYGNIRSGDLGPVPLQFAGMRWDEDAGLYYVRARWYEPLSGKFVSCDPLFLMDGRNTYAYVENNPSNLIDPLGLDSGQARQLMNEYLYLERQRQVISTVNLTYKYIETVVGGMFTAAALLKPEVGLPLKLISAGLSSIGSSLLESIVEYATVATMATIDLRERQIRQEISALGRVAKKEDIPQYSAERYRDPFQSYLPSREDIISRTLDRWEAIEAALDYWAGGVCPTFVQGGHAFKEWDYSSNDTLIARIKTPWPNSLLRSDIPIYGIASGKDFSRYRVEYGEGMDPSKWYLIEESDKPQEKATDFKDISWMQGDLDLKGNLATWNTGLKNWIHLPWHPEEDPTDLNGIYTLRLTVFGKDGQKAEDSIKVEVGRVIAQGLPGIAVSPDKRVTMRFPEQALTHPFRIYTILPLSTVGEDSPPLCKGCEVIGQVYRVREPGDRFIKDVSLEFSINVEDIKKLKAENIGIGRYDFEKNKWVLLETAYDRKSSVFKTNLQELPLTKAIYALILNPDEKLSHPALTPKEHLAALKPVRPGVLLENNFENELGTFKNRDRLVGAVLSRDNKATPDGSYCLKSINENFGGNFSFTIIDRPFDVREYGTMTFDYRIGQDVKIDFFLKVNGRWYNLRFTSDPVDYRNKDVNIANLGAIQDVITDDKWHTASVDLRYLLRQQTKHTHIEEIVMAQWNVSGYMKLEFGSNPRGAVFYIDNFKLNGPGSIEKEAPVLLVDDFNITKSTNAIGESYGAYRNPGTLYFESSLIDVPSTSGRIDPTTTDRNRALQLTFDMTKPEAYGGYWTALKGKNVSDYASIRFRLRTDNQVPPIQIGIRNSTGVEGKTFIAPYLSAPDKDGWRDVHVPLAGLRRITDFSTPDVLFFAVSNKDQSGRGRVLIDNLRFDQTTYPKVADFESPFAWTLLGGDYMTRQNGAAAISAGSMTDISQDVSGKNTVCRISYGGSIGRDYGINGGFSFAGWQVGLNGIDARAYQYLTFRIRGEKGNEKPNFYVSDPSKRACLRSKEVQPISKEWQKIRLSLEHYAKQGIDLSHLNAFEIIFEWEEQAGTIYIDDISFE